MAVTTQPGSGTMMQAPPATPGCPPGLEYLTTLDQVIVKQEVSLIEEITGFETKNKFRIFNTLGQQVYFAGEESDCCTRNLCKTQRGLSFHIADNFGQEVFRVTREFSCVAGIRYLPCDCCRYYSEVTDRNGVLLGHISDRYSCCSYPPKFGLYDSQKNLTAEIVGPYCPIQNCLCSGDIDFVVTQLSDGIQLGVIAKTWEGLLKNCCTVADNFRVSFPVQLDVKMKALMIGAVFIIDIMMYEKKEEEV